MLQRTAIVLLLISAMPAIAQPWTIGVSQCNLGEPWRVQMNADIKHEAEKNAELKVIFKDAQNDNVRQIGHVNEFIQAGVNLIIITPKETEPLTPVVRAAYRKNIPVIVLDRRVSGHDYTIFIGADNRRIGKALGTYVAKLLGGKGNVVELKGLMTSSPGQDRHSGFLEGINNTDIKIIFDADMKWLEPNARKEMESALARLDHIDLVFGHNDPAAHGAWLAAKASGREKQMKFVGIDALPQEGQMYVKQGILDASFEYPTGGKEAVELAVKILNGYKVDKEMILKSHFYTKENIDHGGEWIP